MGIAQDYIASVMGRMNLDALLFWGLENIRYLCGFTGSDGALILTDRERIFLSDSRYEEQAKGEIQGAAFRKYKKKIEGVAQCLKSLKVRRLGFEAAALTCESYQRLKKELPRVILVPLTDQLTNLRSRKVSVEIDKIREAIRIASDSFLDALPRLKPGAKEKAVGDFLEIRMKRRGGEGPGFPTIVASGPRGALPHGKATDKAVEKKELVVIDFGVRFQGYHSDETKTVILGKPDGRQKKIYDLVRRAQERAMKSNPARGKRPAHRCCCPGRHFPGWVWRVLRPWNRPWDWIGRPRTAYDLPPGLRSGGGRNDLQRRTGNLYPWMGRRTIGRSCPGHGTRVRSLDLSVEGVEG